MITEEDSWHPGSLRFWSSVPGDLEVPGEGAGHGGGRPVGGGRGQVGGRGGRTSRWKAKTAPASDNSGSRKRGSAKVVEESSQDQELDDTSSSPNKTPTQVAGARTPLLEIANSWC